MSLKKSIVPILIQLSEKISGRDKVARVIQYFIKACLPHIKNS